MKKKEKDILEIEWDLTEKEIEDGFNAIRKEPISKKELNSILIPFRKVALRRHKEKST